MSNKVEYNGKVYETGKYYKFTDRDYGCVPKIFTLTMIGADKNYPFRDKDGVEWEICEAIKVTGKDAHLFGTIEDAPFKPEVGKLYQFSDHGNSWITRELAEAKEEEPKYRSTCSKQSWWRLCRPVPADQRAEYGD